MNITYDPTADALAITVGVASGRRVSRQLAPGVFADFDSADLDQLIGIEVLAASTRYPGKELAMLPTPVTWLILEEAAQEAAGNGDAISAVTIRRLLNTGKVEGRKQGRDWLISRSELWNYLENRRPAGRPREVEPVASAKRPPPKRRKKSRPSP